MKLSDNVDHVVTLCRFFSGESMEEKYIAAYQRELRQLHHRRVFYILLVGIAFVLFSAVLDYYSVPSLFSDFFRYRLQACFFVSFLFIANYFDHRGRYSFLIGCGGYLLAALLINLQIVRTGGIHSPSYVGLIVIIITYTAIAPLTMLQTLLCGTVVGTSYVFTLYFLSSFPADSFLVLFSNIFFIFCFILIAAIQSWTESRAREKEFVLRMQEDAAARELVRQADRLETEVARRTQEQMALEDRYRMLIDHIVDDVLLVNEQGDILHASPKFFLHMQAENGSQGSLFTFVVEHDRQHVRDDLLAVLARGESVVGFQLRLVTGTGRHVDSEISGTLLQREGQVLGLQLVIRDISRRKLLEQELVESLNIVKKTETAAILALAKLSEHRDITPGKHLERIREYSCILAEELARNPDYAVHITTTYIYDLRQAVVLHDIGKVGIPDAILMKQGDLTAEEKELTRRHTIIGGDVIKAMEAQGEGSGFLAMAKSIAYFHHEKWDGSGYPHGLKGEEIPLSSRIMAVADSYEAMTTRTLYSLTRSHEKAVESIVRGAGSHYDPGVVKAFVARQKDFDRIRHQFAEDT